MGATRLASGKDAAIIWYGSFYTTFSIPTRDEAAEKCPDAGQGKLL